MKITAIKSNCYRVPVRVPLKDEPIAWELVIVQVDTDASITGYGLVGPQTNQAVNAFINHQAGPFLIGADPIATERIWQDLYSNFNGRALTGAWSIGVSAIDIALWDIKGKHYGEPIARLLGGASPRASAYITFGLPSYSREELVQVAKMFVAQGHNRLKMVVAQAGSVAEDARRVQAVRTAVGDDVELMIDANYLFSLPQALELCKLVEPCRISFFEEPVYGNDYRLLADLRKRTSIPIAAGQNLGHQWHHRELIVEGAVDYSQPNVCFVGGFTEAIKVAHLARAFNLPIISGGGWPHHNMHLYAAVPNGSHVEFHLVTWLIDEVLFKDTPKPKNGWVDIPLASGLGFEPNLEALAEYRMY